MAVIAVDFDGTCVTHEYPRVGNNIGAVPVLKKLIDAGHQLILFSMRSDKEQQDAVDWFAKNNIPLYLGRKVIKLMHNYILMMLLLGVH